MGDTTFCFEIVCAVSLFICILYLYIIAILKKCWRVVIDVLVFYPLSVSGETITGNEKGLQNVGLALTFPNKFFLTLLIFELQKIENILEITRRT